MAALRPRHQPTRWLARRPPRLRRAGRPRGERGVEVRVHAPVRGARAPLRAATQDRGFTVLGFPCNQFLGQEPGSADEIAQFCSTTYGVSFPLFEKIEVNGDERHPLYARADRDARRRRQRRRHRLELREVPRSAPTGRSWVAFAPASSPRIPRSSRRSRRTCRADHASCHLRVSPCNYRRGPARNPRPTAENGLPFADRSRDFLGAARVGCRVVGR